MGDRIGKWSRFFSRGDERLVMVDPSTPEAAEALWTMHHDHAKLTQEEARAVCRMAEAYRSLLTHPAGTEAMIQRLRAMRRSLRKGGSDD